MPSIAKFLSSFLSLQSPLLVDSGFENERLPLQLPQTPITASSSFRCLPSQVCWPAPREWEDFNSTLSGRLLVTEPWAQPCYVDSSSYACKKIQGKYGDGFARESIYGAMQNLKWETCGLDSCQLNSLEPTSATSGNCSLGRISSYYVNATDESHVVETVNFVKQHNIRLSIKNTGHDYFGRSSAANSLALWTHNIKRLEYHETFSLSNCKSSGQLSNIGIIGAGTTAIEAFTFFETHDMHITVGAAASVGVAGGFGQAGGHGPLGPSYGLMVDQAVEFNVVTADGQLRTINECNDPDLFWAMRGGGGSTFGVLTAYKLQVHEALPLNVYMVAAEIPQNASEATDITESQSHRDVVTALALNQQQWSKNGIAGYNFFFPDKFLSILIKPSRDTSALVSLTAQWAAFLSTYPTLHIAANRYKTFANYSSFASWTTSPELGKNGAVGIGIAESSRLIPSSQFSTYASVHDLVDAFLQGLQISFEKGAGTTSGSGQIYATTPANTPDDDRKTSVTPAWRNSLWHVVYPGIYTSNTTKTDEDAIFDAVGAAVEPLKKLTPGGGAYLNEGDYKETRWRETFFGDNYDRLLAIKRKWDPAGLFRCWKCVGWEESDDPIDSCYGLSDTRPIPSEPLETA